jgi:hypothetical protein
MNPGEIEKRPAIPISDGEFIHGLFGQWAPQALVICRAKADEGTRAKWNVKYWSTVDANYYNANPSRYYCMSLFDGSTGPNRLGGNYKRAVVFVVDDVLEKGETAWLEGMPTPTYILETSPGSQQWGWALPLDGDGVPDWQIEALQDGIVAKYFGGSDPGMKAVTRVIKLPSSLNFKEKKRLPDGTHPQSRLLHWDPTLRYEIGDLANAALVDISVNRRGRYETGVGDLDLDPRDPFVIEVGDPTGMSADGVYQYECPTRHNHSNDDGGKTLAVWLKADGQINSRCHHGKCGSRSNEDLCALLEQHHGLEPGLFMRHKAYVLTNTAFKDVKPVQPGSRDIEPVPPVFNEVEGELPGDDAIREWISRLGRPGMGQLEMICDRLAYTFPRMNDLQRVSTAKDLMDRFMMRGELSLFKRSVKDAYRRKELIEKRAEAAVHQLERAEADGVVEYKALTAEPGQIDYPIRGLNLDPMAPAAMHLDNLDALCRYHGITIRYNMMTHEVEVKIPRLRLLSDIAAAVSVTYMRDIAMASNLSTIDMQARMHALAEKHAYHPVLEWLDSLPDHDGQDHVGQIIKVLGTPSSDMLDLYIRNWMRQGVVAARASYGHAPPRNVLVFAGAQYVGKTSFFRMMTPQVDGAFAEGLHLDPGDRDSLKKSLVSFVVELGELDATFRKADISKLKAHISNGKDRFRLPYAATEEEWSRRTIYCATVNDMEFLVDPTGNSRWNVVEVNSVDLELMKVLQDQGTIAAAWKQAEAEVDAGTLWYFSRDQVVAFEKHTQKFEREDPYQTTFDALDDMFDWDAPEDKWVTLTNHTLNQMLGIDAGRGRKSAQSLIREYLKKNGYPRQSGKVYIAGRLIRGFRVPPHRIPGRAE